MQDRNMVESVIKDRNINLESSDTNGLNNIFLKNKKIIRSKNFSKALIFEKKNQLFGAQKKRKLFLN